MKKNRFILTFIAVLAFTFSFSQKGIIINSGARIELNNGASLIIGDDLGLINNSTESVFNGNVIFAGNALQEIGGSEISEFNVLEIDNSNGVFLAIDSRVADQLILTSGVIDLTDYNLTLSDVSNVSGTFSSSNMICVDGNGRLIKEISGNDFFLLPVGDLTSSADYSPVEFDFLYGNYTNAYISLGVNNSKHANNPSTTDYLNRYWILSSSGITAFSCDMTFSYVPADLVGSESNIYGAMWNTATWSSLGPASSNQFSGTSDFFNDVTGVETQFVNINNLYEDHLNVYYGNGNIILKSDNNIKINSVEIYNAVGQLINSKAPINEGFEEIPFNNSTGYYLLKINTDKATFAKKFFVK